MVTALGSRWVEGGEGILPQTFVMLIHGIQRYITLKVGSKTKDTLGPQQKGIHTKPSGYSAIASGTQDFVDRRQAQLTLSLQ